MVRALILVALGGCRIGFGASDPPADAPDHDDAAPSDAPPSADHGFFVEVPMSDGSAIGGIDAAHARCLSVLTTSPWLGRSYADAFGLLTPARVRAWLCTSTQCQDLLPSRTYHYATTQQPSRGGAAFLSTAEGYLEDDSRAYGDDEVFGFDDGFHEYMTGRTQANTPQPSGTCGEWATTSGSTNVAVNDTTYYPERLEKYARACNQLSYAICIVDP